VADQDGAGSAVSRAAGRLPWRRLTPAAITAAVALYLLWRVRAILAPFLIALFLAALLDPVVTRIARRGVPRGRAVASIFALAILAVVLAAVLILPSAVAQVSDLASNVTLFADNVSRSTERLTRRADGWYEEHRATLTSLGVKDKPSAFVSQQAGPVSSYVRSVLDSVREALVAMVGQVLWLIIIPLSLFYFLLDYPVLRARLTSLLPAGRRREVDRMMQDIVEIFGAYVRGLAKVCVLYGATAAILFWILRLQYALFLGIAAGVFYAVPYVGPALSMVSVIVIALTMGKGIGYALLAVVVFLFMHVAYDYGVTPRVVGGSVGLHPLVNIFALMCGVTLFGVWGMILAVPVAASLQKVLVHFFPWLVAPPESEESGQENPSPS